MSGSPRRASALRRLLVASRAKTPAFAAALLAAVLLLAALLLAPCPATGTVAPAPWDSFTGSGAHQADSILCAELFAGRKSGTPGGRAAEEWIARQFRLAGLHPGIRGGRYLQPFPVIGLQAREAQLTILDSPFGEIRLLASEDYQPMLTPAAGKVEAEAVFVGYGICAPAKGRDDYEGIDLRGKIAVILRGRPAGKEDWDREYARTHTFRAAVEHGARAVLYCQGDRPVAGAAIAPESYDARIPAAFVSKRILGLLMRRTGHRIEELEERLPEQPVSFATGKRMRFEIKTRGAAADTARNVVAILEGSDPRVGTEVVLIGAHHDHIGHDTHGLLYAGANDNASGTAVVIEMARAAAASGWRPKRTVCFATFAAEEMGLLGSKHLASHLPFDSTRVVAMLNMDMVGHGDGGTGIAGGDRLGPVYWSWLAGLDSTRAAQLEDYRLHGESSDYASFTRIGIPSLGCWSRGDHRYYHDFEDVPEGVRPEVLESVGRQIFSLLAAIADHPAPLADGLGRERNLRAEAVQVAFAPFDAAMLADAEPAALTGEGRLAGRIVRCDQGKTGADEILRRLGRIAGISKRDPGLAPAKGFPDVKEAVDELRTALVPVVGVDLLESLGPDAVPSLRGAGLAGAYVPEGGKPPTEELRRALADAGCFLLADDLSGWTATGNGRAEESRLPVLVRWDRARAEVPAPPDSAALSSIRPMLLLRVEASADSARIAAALRSWGAERVHVDFASGLEKGVDDRMSLRFLAWLRRHLADEALLKSLLGGNLCSL